MQIEHSVAVGSDYGTYISGFERSPQGRPTIEAWSVVGHDRVVGTVHDCPAAPDGKKIITSPVLHVRLVGELRRPLVFTQSGSAYWLGRPSASFGTDQAEHFVWFKSREPAVKQSPSLQDPSLQTAMMKLIA